MGLNKKSVDDINVAGKRVLVRCDFNVPLKDGKITDDKRIKGAMPTIEKLIKDGGKVILCSHLGKVKNGPNEGESLAPVAAALEERLGKKVTFVNDDHVTGEAATAAVAAMKDGDVVLLHDIHEYNVDAVKRFVPDLIAQGFQLVTVPELYKARGETLDAGTVHYRTDPTTQAGTETAPADSTDAATGTTAASE